MIGNGSDWICPRTSEMPLVGHNNVPLNLLHSGTAFLLRVRLWCHQMLPTWKFNWYHASQSNTSAACHSCLIHTHTRTHTPAAWQQHCHMTLRCGHVWPATLPTHAERNLSVQSARRDPGHIHVTIYKALSPQYSHSDSRSREDTQALLRSVSLPVLHTHMVM